MFLGLFRNPSVFGFHLDLALDGEALSLFPLARETALEATLAFIKAVENAIDDSKR